MKSQALYQRLKAMDSHCFENGYEVPQVEYFLFTQLLAEIQKEAILEGAKEAGDTSRLKYASKVLKNKSNERRPILQKAVINSNDMQMFTDSYIGFRLSNHITGLEMHDQNDFSKYPTLDRLMDLAKSDNRKTINYYVSDLKEKLALIDKDGTIDLSLHDDNMIRLQKKYLEIAIYTLGYKNDDIITFNYKVNTEKYTVYPLYIVEKNGSGDSIVLPLRVDPSDK